MEEKSRDYLAGRIKDLAERAYMNGFVTHTDFLSVSETATFHQILAAEKVPSNVRQYHGAGYLLYGGFDEAERAVVCFLPDYMDEESFLKTESEEQTVISCVKIVPLNSRFSDELSHRDYLGSLMNLGIERDQIGDILAGENRAYVFATTEVAKLICRELVRIKHTSVKADIVNPSECDVRPELKEISGSVASERIDAVLAFVFHLSRSEAGRLIDSESVFIDGRTAYSGGYDLKKGARVSVRGYGKFIYDGPTGTTRKGRLFVTVRQFI